MGVVLVFSSSVAASTVNLEDSSTSWRNIGFGLVDGRGSTSAIEEGGGQIEGWAISGHCPRIRFLEAFHNSDNLHWGGGSWRTSLEVWWAFSELHRGAIAGSGAPIA
ncbi:hypothetical protein CRG98_034774 [Punica granatum]|uniref:Uncharacterized protein n=1 Tax=Punica granatum TaxID=22663 RepID=A0A2I0IN81_PUNGR|nr:hypothetical protein CRG98_034774 [Punica granatum]